MDESEKRALGERYLDAYNRFDVDGMMATVHQDVVFENISAGEVNATANGAEALREMAEQAKALFSSRCQTMKTFEADAEGAVITVAYEGVLACDLPNGMKAGETLRLEGRSAFAFRDGLIARIVDES